MASPSAAASAYANLARMFDSPGAAGKTGEAGAGPSFSSVLKGALDGVADAGRKSDTQAMSMVSGKSNIVDVVTAVAETEVAVETLVSVRDKVIQAYEDIMKMPI
jgi:flagellar hook-basal body complex protein FliE